MGDVSAPPQLRLARIGMVADVDPDDFVADAAVIVLERRLAQLGLVADIHARTVDETARTLASARWERADAPWPSPIDLVIVDDSVSFDRVDNRLIPSGVPVVPVTWSVVGDYLVDELRRLLDPSTVEVRRSMLKHLDIAPSTAVDSVAVKDRMPHDDAIEAQLAATIHRVADHLSTGPTLTPDQLTATLRSLEQRHGEERRADAVLLGAARSRLDELGDECERLCRRVEELRSLDTR